MEVTESNHFRLQCVYHYHSSFDQSSENEHDVAATLLWLLHFGDLVQIRGDTLDLLYNWVNTLTKAAKLRLNVCRITQ